jgi:hypothetical protein
MTRNTERFELSRGDSAPVCLFKERLRASLAHVMRAGCRAINVATEVSNSHHFTSKVRRPDRRTFDTEIPRLEMQQNFLLWIVRLCIAHHLTEALRASLMEGATDGSHRIVS